MMREDLKRRRTHGSSHQLRTFYLTCQANILLSIGAPVTPDGGSFCSLLKSRIKRRLAGVDIIAL